MDNISSKNGHFDVDLEKGGVCGEPGSSDGFIFSTIRINQVYSEVVSGGVAGCHDSVSLSCDEGLENVSLIVVGKKDGEEKGGDVSVKKVVREKPMAMSAKKPPKPPRPPRGLSLDSADQKLIRELHELAKLKRARVERMKALKKAKEAKAASSKSQVFATLLTVLFCIVLLFQGLTSRTNSAVNSLGSPIPSAAIEDSVVSVQQYPSSSASNVNGPGSESPRVVIPVSGSVTPEQGSIAVG